MSGGPNDLDIQAAFASYLSQNQAESQAPPHQVYQPPPGYNQPQGGNQNQGGYDNFGDRGGDDRGERGGDRGGYRGRGRGGYRGGRDQSSGPRPNATVYFSGLGADISEASIAERFGSIGIIKMDKKNNKPKVNLYVDKESGVPKGDGTVTYDDPESTKAAIEWFNGTDFNGRKMQVEMAVQKAEPVGGGFGDRGRGRGGFGRGGFDRGGRGGFGDRGGRGGGRGGSVAPGEGDWNCTGCGNTNWARRMSCNKCNAPKPAGASSGPSGGYGGGRGGGDSFRGGHDNFRGGQDNYRGGHHGGFQQESRGGHQGGFQQESRGGFQESRGGGFQDSRGGYGGGNPGENQRGGYGGNIGGDRRDDRESHGSDRRDDRGGRDERREDRYSSSSSAPRRDDRRDPGRTDDRRDRRDRPY